MAKPYRPIEEIMEIFQINLATIRSVIRKYKVDTFVNKGKLYIHTKDFYKSYTKHFNPSLFDLDDRKKSVKEQMNIHTSSGIFQKLFGTSYEVKNSRQVNEQNLWQVKNL